MSIKHLDFTIKAPKQEHHTITLPSWYGTATGAISALADDPHALDQVGTIDIDAVHRKDEETE